MNRNMFLSMKNKFINLKSLLYFSHCQLKILKILFIYNKETEIKILKILLLSFVSTEMCFILSSLFYGYSYQCLFLALLLKVTPGLLKGLDRKLKLG